jgi:hypothetical protein
MEYYYFLMNVYNIRFLIEFSYIAEERRFFQLLAL